MIYHNKILRHWHAHFCHTNVVVFSLYTKTTHDAVMWICVQGGSHLNKEAISMLKILQMGREITLTLYSILFPLPVWKNHRKYNCQQTNQNPSFPPPPQLHLHSWQDGPSHKFLILLTLECITIVFSFL